MAESTPFSIIFFISVAPVVILVDAVASPTVPETPRVYCVSLLPVVGVIAVFVIISEINEDICVKDCKLYVVSEM